MKGEIGWLEFDLDAQTLELAKASEQWQPNPNGGGACLEVADLDAALAHVKSRQMRVVMETVDYFNCPMGAVRSAF